MFSEDTIAAIATALAPAGINIIRISGPDAFSVCGKIFVSARGKSFDSLASGSATYGFIRDGEDIVDEVYVLKFKAPHTYTCEDVVEIQCHGGILVTKKILSLVLAGGARLAQNGEFTKRAFLNGRIDLSRAEAVMDLIGAESDLSRRNSMRQLRGDLYEAVTQMRDKLLGMCAFIEAALDDPEHIEIEGYREKMIPQVEEIENKLATLLSTFDEGKIIKDGINVVIAGCPNAGKSSLLNALLKEERAIVTDIAGTTRDIICESLDIGGLVLNLSDTAGLRESADTVESIGVERAKRAADEADLVLYVVDSVSGLSETDGQNIREFGPEKVVLIYNKVDLSGSVAFGKDFPDCEKVAISALTGAGTEDLKDLIKSKFLSMGLEPGHDIIVTNARHAQLLTDALRSVRLVLSGARDGVDEDLISIDIMDAYKSLGLITGSEYSDDLADRIFSDFCMGK